MSTVNLQAICGVDENAGDVARGLAVHPRQNADQVRLVACTPLPTAGLHLHGRRVVGLLEHTVSCNTLKCSLLLVVCPWGLSVITSPRYGQY